MQTDRILLTLLAPIVLASHLNKPMCAAACHSNDKHPSHPSMAMLGNTLVLQALIPSQTTWPAAQPEDQAHWKL